MRRPAYQRILLRGGRGRKLYVLGDAQAVSWVGVIGRGGGPGCTEKEEKHVHIGFLLSAFMFSWAFAPSEVRLL